MNEPPDPFEILRRLNPIKPEELDRAGSAKAMTDGLQRILADRPDHAQARVRSARTRRRWAYLIGLVSLVALAAAAWAITHGAPLAVTVGCYETADLRAHTVVVPLGDRTPVASCRSVWRRGEFGPRAAAPRLQACALPSGAPAVFPSPSKTACKALRLKSLATARSPETAAASLASVKATLVPVFLAKPCMNDEQATSTVHAALREASVAGWTVKKEQPFDARRPCASLAFDEQQHVVLLVPLPRG